jgi:hypothetical protein
MIVMTNLPMRIQLLFLDDDDDENVYDWLDEPGLSWKKYYHYQMRTMNVHVCVFSQNGYDDQVFLVDA